MAIQQIIFIVVAAATLGSALMVVLTRNLVHSALWLVAALFGIAVFYVLLQAGFLAVAQVVIYIGAIAILMIFTIMLTRRVATETGPQVNINWPWSLLLAVVFFGVVAWVLSGWSGFYSQTPALPPTADPLVELGQALVDPDGFVLPFELVSVLLLAALIGSVMIAWDRVR